MYTAVNCIQQQMEWAKPCSRQLHSTANGLGKAYSRGLYSTGNVHSRALHSTTNALGKACSLKLYWIVNIHSPELHSADNELGKGCRRVLFSSANGLGNI